MSDKQNTKGITVKKMEDMAEWYGQVVIKSELADYAPIRGFMIIRPRGYALWEAVQDAFNQKIRAAGVENAYFPVLIPESFFKREAEHAEGFTPEVAWLERQAGEQERYALRPTSETIMYDSYSRWIRSWRDLPLKMNQWCNIIRWEVQDTKIFLRSREFLWQEGHCVYETEKECQKETLLYLELYRQIAEDLLAVPVLLGRKTESEKFAGAQRTYCIEGFMPDGKALQMGTSHMLGQSFAKAFNIQYLGKEGQNETPWQNSWGISTRMLGALVITHGDDKGLIIPPRMARNKLAIVPIFVKDEAVNREVLTAAKQLAKALKRYAPLLDVREQYSPGWKFNEHELNGMPLRIELGPKDLQSQQVVLARRDTGEKEFVPIAQAAAAVKRTLDAIQDSLYQKAKQRMDEALTVVKTWDELVQADKDKKLMLANHCGEKQCEREIKELTGGVTARCIPLKNNKADGNCVRCGNAAKYKVYFARAY